MTGRRYLQAKVTGTVDKMHVKAGLDLCFSLPIIGQKCASSIEPNIFPVQVVDEDVQFA